jgi:hypothetical protein
MELLLLLLRLHFREHVLWFYDKVNVSEFLMFLD